MSAKTHIDAAKRARARVTRSRRSVNNVPQFDTFGRANVAEVRHKRGKTAKSLSFNDIKFNIIRIMRFSPAPTPNRCRNPRFDPPPLRFRSGANAHDPFTHPEKNFPQIHATGVLTHERPQPPR